jgi:regulatory protein
VARSTPDPSQLTPRAAVTAGLLMLGRRELSSRQLADRLRRKGFPHDVVETALASLRESGALNDARAAAARARHGVAIHRHGRSRVLRQVKALGVSDETARHAVSAAFSDVSEDQMLASALARKLRGAEPPSDPKAVRRLQGWLLRQGFEPDRVQRLMRRKFRIEND